MKKNDDTKTVKSLVRGFSRAKLEAGRNGLGLCIARDESKRCCCVFLRPSYIGVLAELVRRRFVRRSREISLVPSRHKSVYQCSDILCTIMMFQQNVFFSYPNMLH